MTTEIKKLPAIIEAFISSTNEHNGDAYISTFADDAMVNDVARNFWGKASIKKWADKEIITPKITLKPAEVVEHYGEFMITSLIDGNYDKSKVPDPLYLDYFFTLKSDKIVRLIITKNRAKSAK